MASNLRHKRDAKLIVLHVFGVNRSNYTPFDKDSRINRKKVSDEEYAALIIKEMKNVYAKELEHTENVIFEAKVGRPDKEILRKAHEEDVDLIIMGAHTSRGRRWSFTVQECGRKHNAKGCEIRSLPSYYYWQA